MNFAEIVKKAFEKRYGRPLTAGEEQAIDEHKWSMAADLEPSQAGMKSRPWGCRCGAIVAAGRDACPECGRSSNATT